MKGRLLFIVLLTTFSLSAQLKSVVLDSISGKPIAYVNIWVENENIGTTSNENGVFELNINEKKNIVFSALGFDSKTISSFEMNKVLLQPKVYQLDEVIVENLKKTKELEIGDAQKIHHSQLSGVQPWIYAKLFNYEEKFSETPFLKNIVFYTNSDVKEAKLKIRVFELKDSIPSDDMLYEDIIVTVKKGMKKNKLDVSKYNLKFPKNGILIGLEWLIIEENKYVLEYKEYNSNTKTKHPHFAPSLVINFSDIENAFRYYGGKWIKSIKNTSNNGKPWDNKVMTPAINLTLTN